VERGVQLGANEVLVHKPFTAARLIQALRHSTWLFARVPSCGGRMRFVEVE
jgi:hypothetical protein